MRHYSHASRCPLVLSVLIAVLAARMKLARSDHILGPPFPWMVQRGKRHGKKSRSEGTLYLSLCTLIVLTGCASVYEGVAVDSRSASEFYFVRQDIWIANEFDNPAKRDAPGAMSSFGPTQIGSWVPLLEGSQYVIIPVCNGRLAWDKAIRPVIHEQKRLRVNC